MIQSSNFLVWFYKYKNLKKSSFYKPFISSSPFPHFIQSRNVLLQFNIETYFFREVLIFFISMHHFNAHINSISPSFHLSLARLLIGYIAYYVFQRPRYPVFR